MKVYKPRNDSGKYKFQIKLMKAKRYRWNSSKHGWVSVEAIEECFTEVCGAVRMGCGKQGDFFMLLNFKYCITQIN